jgi:hypothetical protein
LRQDGRGLQAGIWAAGDACHTALYGSNTEIRRHTNILEIFTAGRCY